MYVAVAIGTLLLGGWVLDSPEDQQETTLPEQTAPLTTTPSATTPGAPSDATPGAQTDAARKVDQLRARMGLLSSAQGAQPQRPATGASAVMPSSPTDTGSPGAYGMPSHPTAAFSPGSDGMSPEMIRAYGSLQPNAPTAQRGAAYRPMLYGGAAQTQSRIMPSGATTSNLAPPVSEKAFSGYRAPAAISPYMNLFRTGTDMGTIDNYTTLVRPEVEQRFTNKQFGKDIHGLQQNYRTQGMNLQKLNQQTRTLEGVGTPQFYMNYGKYYNSGSGR